MFVSFPDRLSLPEMCMSFRNCSSIRCCKMSGSCMVMSGSGTVLSYSSRLRKSFSGAYMSRSGRSFKIFSSRTFICPGLRKRSAGSALQAFRIMPDIRADASHGAGSFSPEIRLPSAASLSRALIFGASGSRNGARFRFINL